METLVWVALAAPVGVAAALWFDSWCERRWDQRHVEEPPSNLDRWDGIHTRDELWP
jgi:hypothetical protein